MPPPVVDACIRGAGEDSNLSVSWCVLDIAGKMVSAGEQRSVLRTGTASTVSLPLGFLPFMETVMGKTSFAEVFPRCGVWRCCLPVRACGGVSGRPVAFDIAKYVG